MNANGFEQWEQDNSLTRDIELAQAFLITLEIGLWSGHSRKVEIAESCFQILLTMLRRDGRLRHPGRPGIIVRGDEEGDSLTLTWKAWVEHESFKRLSFRVLQHDTNCSMALLTSPLISYAEILLPFPDSVELWSAASAEQWKASYLSQANWNSEQGLVLANYLHDPEGFNSFRNTVDMPIVNFVFLSCAWALAWEYIQLNSLQRAAGSGHWNALLMASRQEEILKLLNGFRIRTDFHFPYAQETTMRLELILMHMHMPLEDVQLFAGMEGQEQARIVYPRIIDWVRSEAARKAIWHAGQIIRAARLLPKGRILGLLSVMVYHASLALWVYGLLSERSEATEAWGGFPAASRQSHNVHLDEADSLALQRFTQLRCGSPCIQGLAEQDGQPVAAVNIVYLSQADKVMATVTEVLRRNHDGLSRPHLVDNLIKLISGLQKASTKAGSFINSM